MSQIYLEQENRELHRILKSKELEWAKERALLHQEIQHLKEKMDSLARNEVTLRNHQKSLTQIIECIDFRAGRSEKSQTVTVIVILGCKGG